ncbi:MAG: ribosome biogenesis GTPase Der [Deltaproteobacteria bacterium]|nr:ribosome biogenesis GTPase Der [Deltaproteobacteria bacterium]MBW2017195.1 ribosome biogenesis GTPase Der [Deltaproteobacteria bacterium]MBW2129267.1 ribosome biogenesis GTPase Der [Deltaproteobacteria bacterium]MBW2303969.1 ribosome biogenesis GTPase Der [Deltaproteobacteria bacterium]
MTSVITILGRPNVGKSTLFNRLSRSRDALVDDIPGITRDRLYASVHWGDRTFTLMDTGGFDEVGDEPFMDLVREQVRKAVEESDIIIFMVDGRQGIMPGDEEIAHMLRRSGKKVFLAANKIDGPEHEGLTADFYRLGVEKVFPLSAAHGYGLKALMNEVVKELPEETPEENDEAVRVAVLGRPNVGKSSLVNRILGSERVLVSDIPGTTRDSVDIRFTRRGRDYVLIDTAGIRRKSKVREKIDKFSMIKAVKSLDRCHLAVVLLDASEGVVEQDARICGYALDRGRGLILGLNKWDLVKHDPDTRRRLLSALDRQLKFVSFAPRITLSARTGEHVGKLFEKIDHLSDQYGKRIGTGEVNRVLEKIFQLKPPPLTGKGRLKFFYATQIDVRPPTFVLFVNRPELIHFSYERFLANQFRERFGLDQTPIRIFFRKR